MSWHIWVIFKSDNIFFSILIINSQMQRRNGAQNLLKEDPGNAGDNFTLSRGRNYSQNMDMLNLMSRPSSEVPDLFANLPNNSLLANRQESHGNLFSGFHAEEQLKPAPVRVNLPEQYAMECLEYEKYLFDNRIKLIIKKMSVHAYNIYRNEKECTFFVFPIQKLLTTIAKKLLLNRFELLFLQYVLEETKFRYNIDCIAKNHQKFNSFIFLSDSETSNIDNKLMQIYILYCAYYSKKSLNELPQDNIFTDFLKEFCPEFKERFPEWTQQSGVANKINPKMLNKIFKKLTFYSDQTHDDVENFSLVVEEILDISPAYNADKNGKVKKPRKKKGQEQKVEQQDSFRFEKEEGQQKFSEIIQHESQFEMDPPLFKNKKSSFISNIDPLEPRHYFTRSMSNNE